MPPEFSPYQLAFMAAAKDGAEFTSHEVTALLNLQHPSQANQFLHSLKIRLAQGETTYRLNKIKVKGQRELRWKIVTRASRGTSDSLPR